MKCSVGVAEGDGLEIEVQGLRSRLRSNAVHEFTPTPTLPCLCARYGTCSPGEAPDRLLRLSRNDGRMSGDGDRHETEYSRKVFNSCEVPCALDILGNPQHAPVGYVLTDLLRGGKNGRDRFSRSKSPAVTRI